MKKQVPEHRFKQQLELYFHGIWNHFSALNANIHTLNKRVFFSKTLTNINTQRTNYNPYSHFLHCLLKFLHL